MSKASKVKKDFSFNSKVNTKTERIVNVSKIFYHVLSEISRMIQHVVKKFYKIYFNRNEQNEMKYFNRDLLVSYLSYLRKVI
jgi:hypothetical protein